MLVNKLNSVGYIGMKTTRYGIKSDDECLYCSEKDSIEHTFLNCQFVKIFVNNIMDWFNAANNSKFAPTIEEKLFGITSGPYEKEILKNFIT